MVKGNLTVNLLQRLKSIIAWWFSFQNVDEHYVIKFFGLKFCGKHKVNYDFKEVKECGVIIEKRTPKIIISLTTFPARINMVYKTISTLLEQTEKPDEVVLWLADEQFPNRELPSNLTRLQEYGLTIKWCNDIKSYKKLIPSLREYSDDIIITVDDDYYYDKNLVKSLLEEHKKYPKCIIGGRAMILKPDKNWQFKLKRRSYVYDGSYLPSYLNPFIGFAGVLYPPNSLHKDVLDESKFMKIIPTNDDAWFWINAVKNKTKFIPCKNSYKLKFYQIENSQEVGLYQVNGKDTTQGINGEEAATMLVNMYPETQGIIKGRC